MPTTYIGTIRAFSGSWGSGLGVLVIERDGGKTDLVHCENAPTVRALEGAFGNVIAPGHTVNNRAIKGKRIVYSVDGLGLLIGFTPEKDWKGPNIPQEGIEEEK